MWPGFPGVEFKFFAPLTLLPEGETPWPQSSPGAQAFSSRILTTQLSTHLQSGWAVRDMVMLYITLQFLHCFWNACAGVSLFKGYSPCAHLAFPVSTGIVTSRNALPWRCWHLCRTVRSILPAMTSASFSVTLKINHNKTKRLLNFIGTCWHRKCEIGVPVITDPS